MEKEDIKRVGGGKMTNSRRKGKRGEIKAVHMLSDIFPDIHRNWLAQTAKEHNGADLAGCKPLNIEVKYGKVAKIKKIRSWLDQVALEGEKTNWDVVLALPEREEPYIVMPFADWKEIIALLKREGLI